MEDSTISFNPQSEGASSLQFEPLREGPAKIKVIGVGGGGGNAVNHMYRQGIHGVEFIVCNTDAKALETSPVPNKIVLGTLGAGNVPERAKQLAKAHENEIRDAISDDTQMLFITAGMGGGTGTGAAPVIAEIAKKIELDDEMVKHILVVAIVTEPFSFEGKKRRQQAEDGIMELKKYVDAILVINNDNLRTLGGNLSLKQAFSQADDVLLTAAKGIAEIITVSAYVNIDFRDVNTVMEGSGTALMGAGEGTGENRARQAIEKATTSVLLNDNDIRGAQNILLYFSCSPNHQITMDELGEVTDYLTELTGSDETNVIWGIGDDEELNEELHITLIATGFHQKQGRNVIDLDKKEDTPDAQKDTSTSSEPKNEKNDLETVVEENKNEPQDIHESPVDDSGIHMVHKGQTVNPNAAGVGQAAAQVSQQRPPVEVVKEVSNVQPAAKPQSDDPFNSSKVYEINGKRFIQLETPAEPAATPQNELPANEVQNNSENPVKPVEKQDVFDQIRVIKRNVEPQPAQQPIAVQERNVQGYAAQANNAQAYAPQQNNVTTVNEPVTAREHVAFQKPVAQVERPMQPTQPSYADQQMARVLTPPTDEEKVKARSERIRRMNELLHDPEGVRVVEGMTTAELSSDPIYYTTHSSESDAARTVVEASGQMNKGSKLYDDLPD